MRLRKYENTLFFLSKHTFAVFQVSKWPRKATWDLFVEALDFAFNVLGCTRARPDSTLAGHYLCMHKSIKAPMQQAIGIVVHGANSKFVMKKKILCGI